MVYEAQSTGTSDLHHGDLFAERYRIEHLLGEGDRKRTFLAHDTKFDDRLVAIAVVKAHAVPLDPDGTQREANLLGRVGGHPNIVGFYDGDPYGDPQYLVFQYLSGGTLAELVKRTSTSGGHLTAETIIRYGRQLARALAHVHAASLLHRDVAPQNVWLDQREEAHLGDFDSAIVIGNHGALLPLTTEAYASPEERSGHHLDQRSDLYSLGGVLVCLALGELRFGDPAVIREQRSDLPPSLVDLLLSLVADSPDGRPANADEVLKRLNEIRHSRDVLSIVAIGEGPQVEFKSSMRFPRDIDKLLPTTLPPEQYRAARRALYVNLEKAVLKTIAAFLNSDGGTLLIGVTDEQKIVGIEDDYSTFDPGGQDADSWQLNLKQKLINAFGAEIMAVVHPTLETPASGTVARIACQRRDRPTWLIDGKQEEFYIRAASSSEPLSPSKAAQYIMEHWSS